MSPGKWLPCQDPSLPRPREPRTLPGLHTSPRQFVGKPSRPRGDCTASHFLQFLPSACRHGYLGGAGGEVEVGWNQFCPGFYFPRCRSAKGAVTSGSVSREAKGWEVLGCGGVDKEPLRPASQEGWAWVREKLRGGGEGERAASPGPVPMAMGAGLRPGSGSSAPRACRECTERGCLFSWPGALWAETLFQASGCQIHPHWLEK